MSEGQTSKVHKWITLQSAPHIEAKKVGNTVYVRGEATAMKDAASLWSLNSKSLIEKLGISYTCDLKTENLSFGFHEGKSFFLAELVV